MNDYQVGVFPVTGAGKVVLVTSRSGRGWIFPKGNREKGRSDRAVARDEAYEEAGLRGVMKRDYEEFRISSAKAHKLRIFRMQVSEISSKYPEAHERHRAVVSFDEAEKMLQKDLRNILRKMRHGN